ncbi:MAG: hypothetical protein JJU02_01545, partial [Cryomorphaceae bacterium]|nr:hypothetical protein [Cryomorphaceae bacterium]
YYTADVIKVTDYYPFGWGMPGRRYNQGDYRYGFNTQEKVDEVKGSGNHYTAEFWEYDPRVVKRWNTDPKPNPSFSPYAINQCNPIWFSDPMGDTVKVEGSRGFVRRTNKALDRMQKTEEGKRMYDKLHSSENVYTIRKYDRDVTKVNSESDLPEGWAVGDIGFTGSKWSNGFFMGKGGWVSLGHELSHTEDVEDGAVSDEAWQTPDGTFSYTPVLYDPTRNTYSYGSPVTVNVPPILVDEVRAVDRENKMRAQAGIGLRTHYNHVKINSATVPDGRPTIIIRYTQQLVKEGIGTHPNYNTNYNLLRKK